MRPRQALELAGLEIPAGVVSSKLWDRAITSNKSWRLCARGSELACRQWQGDLVVFNPISGATHLLDIVSGEVFRALMEGPAGARDLARRIAKLLEVDCNEETVAAAERILDNLDQLGLAEPAGPDAP